MSSLVDALTAQHRAVQRAAAQLELALASSDGARVASLLSGVRVALLAHLELEDRELYPKMIAAAAAAGRDDQVLIARGFSDKMLLISERLRSFLSRHSGDRLDLATVRVEWKDVLAGLTQRIHSEESVLYPLHDELVATPRAKP